MNPSYPKPNASSGTSLVNLEQPPSAAANDRTFLVLFFCCVSVVAIASASTPSAAFHFPSVLLTAVMIVAVYFTVLNRGVSQTGFRRRSICHSKDEGQHSNGRVDEEELFRSVFDHAAGMALVAPDGQWLTVNRSLCEALGYADWELRETTFQEIVHPDDIGAIVVQIEKLLDGTISSHQVEHRFIHKLGHTVWVLLNISLIRDLQAGGSPLVFQFQDITDRKHEEERLVHNVFHDALTGLPNRALFMDRLKLATERSRRRKGQVFAVLFLDLDCFKTINDSLGHIMGDQLLIEIARRLKACLRTTDTIARLGGDEFTVLLEELTGDTELLRIVERLQGELARPFRLGTQDLAVTTSIGVASSGVGYERAEEILRDADAAMYRAKSAGKARHEVFDRNRYARSENALPLEIDLAQATERQQLQLHYQPIVSLEAGKLLGFEALARWRHPQRDLISPEEFIPLAEDSGAIIAIGKWVLRDACLQLKQWQERFPFHRSLSVSVNLSSKQLMQPDLVHQIIDILRETDLDPRMLKLELTESTVMENIGTATVMLQQLRALGVELGIDDFGTGYSSLSYLHRLPINWLKIDRSFVTGMIENDDNQEIIKTIVTLARSLRMNVVAEGIETVEQLAKLRLLSCDAGQGFLFSKPTDAETAGTLLGTPTRWQSTIASLDSYMKPAGLEQSQLYYPVNPVSNRPTLLRAV